MCHKTIDARANVNMFFGPALEDTPRYQEVLMKIVTPGSSALLLLFMGIGI
jgi:isochorismate hydrolase